MRIGEVAETYGLSIDTLRYYIRMGLLVPEGTGRYSRCEFRERDLADLELILRMKKQHFSLQDILTALTFKRTSNMIEPQTIRVLTELYEKKRYQLLEQIGGLHRALESIDRDMARMPESKAHPVVMTGVPLRALSLLECPVCGNRMRLENADLDERYVYRGVLRCSCGRELQIADGILETGNLYTGGHDRPDMNRELYTDAGGIFVSCIKKGMNKICRYLEHKQYHAPVIMETHINGLFFAYNHLEAVPAESLYIVTDKYAVLLQEYKRLLESMGVQRDFLFIADNSMHFPLREGCVDLLISCMSENEYCLYETGSYISDMKPFLSVEAEIIGVFSSLDDRALSQKKIHKKYPEGNPLPFSLTGIEKRYREAGYRFSRKEEGVMTKTNNTGKFSLACHVPGEAMRVHSFRAIPERAGNAAIRTGAEKDE